MPQTLYVRDASGTVLAIYQKSGTEDYKRIEAPIYGAGRLGTARYNGGTGLGTLFEIKDHLGNVRATVQRNGAPGTSYFARDYFPFGLPMQEAGTKYRYGYQGDFSEEDEETGFNHFELREYDPVIGRWMNPDPYRQYASPYMSMGNNPVSSVDPDGGFTDPDCPECQGMMLEAVEVNATRMSRNE